MTLSVEDQIVQQLLKSQHVLLLASAPADGDSLGSAVSFYRMLTKMGKRATVICPETVPKDLKFLPLMEKVAGEFQSEKSFVITVTGNVKEVHHQIAPGKVNILVTPEEGTTISEKEISFSQGAMDYDLIITVDTGDLQQLGKIYEQHPDMFYKIPLINIDHHVSNNEFGLINLVDITASSTTQILVPLFRKMEQATGMKFLDEDTATLLLVGLVTDTGSFQHSNTTPQAFAVAAELLSLGARQQEIIKNVYKTKSLAMLKLWGQVLSKIQFAKEHRFVWSTVTQRDLEETGADMEDSGAIIDELLNNAPGAEVVALLKEKQPGMLSGSIRTTTPQVDSDKIAALFGGGGHKRAAGFRMKNVVFEEAVHRVVSTILEVQAKRYGVAASQQVTGAPEHLTPHTADNPTDSTIILHDLGKSEEGKDFYRFET
jgi:phosphoesterase RecJ-like protein